MCLSSWSAYNRRVRSPFNPLPFSHVWRVIGGQHVSNFPFCRRLDLEILSLFVVTNVACVLFLTDLWSNPTSGPHTCCCTTFVSSSSYADGLEMFIGCILSTGAVPGHWARVLREENAARSEQPGWHVLASFNVPILAFFSFIKNVSRSETFFLGKVPSVVCVERCGNQAVGTVKTWSCCHSIQEPPIAEDCLDTWQHSGGKCRESPQIHERVWVNYRFASITTSILVGVPYNFVKHDVFVTPYVFSEMTTNLYSAD